jgi:hypothetical protein
MKVRKREIKRVPFLKIINVCIRISNKHNIVDITASFLSCYRALCVLCYHILYVIKITCRQKTHV